MKIAIGIDPDTIESGLAVYGNGKLELFTFPLFQLFMKLVELKMENEITVYLESGHLVKGIWHKGGVGAAKRVGANHQIGKEIEKFLIYSNIKYHLVNPQGYSQYSHKSFCRITGWNEKVRTNSEKRVAGLLCFGK